jgi:hypothetical protein
MTKMQDPDPLVRGTDPRIRIRTKMSLIRWNLELESPSWRSERKYLAFLAQRFLHL